jgi:hypothetical protein
MIIGACTSRLTLLVAGVLTFSVALSSGAWATTEISTADQLIALSGDLASLDTSYSVTAPIDLSEASSHLPIGTSYIGSDSNPFVGTFDGNGYLISGLTGSLFWAIGDGSTATVVKGLSLGTSIAGVVGEGVLSHFVGLGATVSDVHASGSLTQSGSYADGMGGLVGINEGEIRNSSTDVRVVSTISRVGGLVGTNAGTIESSRADGEVSGITEVGGLAGFNTGLVHASISTGNVSGVDTVGGLVGNNASVTSYDESYYSLNSIAEVQNSVSTGLVTGQYNVGGLVGVSDGLIINSAAQGNVSGISSTADSIGGLVGWNNSYWLPDSPTSFIQIRGQTLNSLATGDVDGEANNLGGLVGWNDGQISNSISTGNVSSTRTNGVNVGGLVGLNTYWADDSMNITQGVISNSFSEGNACGKIPTEEGLCSSVDRVGALVGGNAGIVEFSLAAGSAVGRNNVGGLVGSNDSTGSISASVSKGSAFGENNVGGLVGENRGLVENSTSIGAATSSSGGLAGSLIGNNFYLVYGSWCGGYDCEPHWGEVSTSIGYGNVVSEGNDFGLIGSDDPLSPYLGADPIVDQLGTGMIGSALLNKNLESTAWGSSGYINRGNPYLLAIKNYNFYEDLTPPIHESHVRIAERPIEQEKSRQEIASNKIIKFLTGESNKPTVSDFRDIGVVGVTAANLPILLKILKDLGISQVDPELIAKQIKIANALLAKQKKAKQALKVKKASFESSSWTSFIPSLLLG